MDAPAVSLLSVDAAGVPSFGRRFAVATMFLAVGAAAGGLACGVIALYGDSFHLPDHVLRILKQEMLTIEDYAVLNAAQRVVNYQNTALSVALLGGVAGGVLGLAVGMRRRTVAASLGGLGGGVLLGAVCGGIGGLIELYAAYWLWPMEFQRPYKTMISHSAAFLTAGLGIGLAAGLAARSVRHSLGVVFAAALIAGLAYPGLAAALFPISNTDAVVPVDMGPRLLWSTMPVALMGLALGRAGTAGRGTRP